MKKNFISDELSYIWFVYYFKIKVNKVVGMDYVVYSIDFIEK